MSSFIRGAVSKKKRRYQKNGFDLDLTYVTPRIVAMGFPSENVEAAFRNPMKEVLRFLDSFHKDHYKVYNLCSERHYDHEKFYNRVEVFPFDDHNAPPFELIMQFCLSVEEWLAQDDRNIAVIHCKAGKGRTGLMISAWMLYSKEWASAKDALNFYAAMRTYNQKGVTIPSQIRYVYYFEESLKVAPENKTLLLNKVTFHTLPKVAHVQDINFYVNVGKTLVFTFKDHEEKLRKSGRQALEVKRTTKRNKRDGDDDEEEESAVFDCGSIPVFGDINIEFSEKSSKIFAFWFSSLFVKDNRLVLKKEELDKAHKDTSHKSYHQNFRIELIFSDLSPDQAQATSLTVVDHPADTAVSSSSSESSSLSSSPSSPLLTESNGLKKLAELEDLDRPTTTPAEYPSGSF
jgi:phosphatidylinositol-3,4,5-trisphosphate 3-phosphatase/dual-specificity protein phosphatase PTEN